MSRWLVTGSAGHLGEALVRVLREQGEQVVGLDRLASPTTTVVASLTDSSALAAAAVDVDHVLHTATLHKPHVGSHTRAEFVDTNIAGTLTVLEAAAAAGAASVVLTSSTSAFGRALTPEPGEPAAWITEDVAHRVRNIYGKTKTPAVEHPPPPQPTLSPPLDGRQPNRRKHTGYRCARVQSTSVNCAADSGN